MYKKNALEKIVLICFGMGILSIQYCMSAAIHIRHERDLVEYVTHHPQEEELEISFAENIPPIQRTEILNNSFAQLAQRNLTLQITGLYLSNNQLTQPPVLTGLPALQTLDLSNNQLTGPPVLTCLIALQAVDLSYNKLTEPPVLTGLTALLGLSLSNNQLTEPPVLTGLPALEMLYLRNNQLTTPPDLTGLIDLQAVDLSYNKLTEPPILTGLTALQWLQLSNNQLTEPPVLTGLTSLQKLYLNENRLTEPLYIPSVLRFQLRVWGYDNILYGEPPVLLKKLKSLVTEEQLAQIRPLVLTLDNEEQAKIIATAWLSQQNSEQDPTVLQSSTNIVFFAPHVFFTQEGVEEWKRINQGRLRPLPTHPNQPFLMQLPLHSLDTLLTALYGDYELNDLPVEDPIMKHIEFRVNLAEFNRLVTHFIIKYNLAPLTEAEINSCKTDVQGQYFVKELATLIRQKMSAAQEFITADEAIKMVQHQIQEAKLPPISDAAIANILRASTRPQGIQKSSLENFIKSYIRSRQQASESDE